MEKTKVYFASDQHFGAPTHTASLAREKLFVNWLDDIKTDAHTLFLLGDLFDFWFEYKQVVPKGFVRVLGKLAELQALGIQIHFFVGNHDLWMRDYFTQELNIPVYHEPKVFTLHNKTFLIGHGDGLGPGDYGFKRMKKIFTNPLCKWLFNWLHPDIGVALAKHLSVKNKLISGAEDVTFLGVENEWLILYCKEVLQTQSYDYFVFGHRHLPLVFDLNGTAKYVNTGDWIKYFSYGVLDNGQLTIAYYNQNVS